MTAATARCRLYVISPESIDPASFPDSLAAAFDAGDVACFQLRLKQADDDTIRRAIDRLLPIAFARDVAFILNDRPDLAKETGCDGVHLGQGNESCAAARKLLGPDRIVGIASHGSRHLAIDAAEAGADYVSFGPFYDSLIKPDEPLADPELLGWWNEIMTVPSVAIGGLTPANCGPIVTAGADFIAAISAIWHSHQTPAEAVAAFNRAIADAAR